MNARRVEKIIAILILACLFAPSALAADLRTSLKDLAQSFVSRGGVPGKLRVAVLDFPDLDGKVGLFGKYAADRFTVYLYQTGKFVVFERSRLDKIIEEQSLQLSGAVSDDTIKKIGALTGVDAIFIGSYTAFSRQVEVSVRCLSTQTAEIYGMSDIAFDIDQDIAALLGKAMPQAADTVGAAAIGPAAAVIDGKAPSAAPGYAFYEDFSGIREGEAPAHWIGAQDYMVKRLDRRSGLVPMKPVGDKSNQFIVPELRFPDDFSLEILLSVERWRNGTSFQAYVGNISFGMRNGDWEYPGEPFINGSGGNRDGFERNGNLELLITLEKRGKLFTLYVDGIKRLMLRVDNYEKGNSLRLGVSGSNAFNTFSLYRIALKPLAD